MAKKEVSSFTMGRAAAEEEQQQCSHKAQHSAPARPTARCLKTLLSPGMHPGLWTPFSIKCNNTKPECDLFFSSRKLIFHAWPNTTELTSISITAAAALPWVWQPAAVTHATVTDTAQLVLPLTWHCQPHCDPGASKIQILPWSKHLSFFPPET